ncbi:ASCH domain-containing protein [Virgibacillus soli]|uniref:ASCH domain-containing protein n=1 Tax=Paracerasibacillus soli TaxID=480284 RepID=A0ABU5CRX2_9BACI|nr:ASCH domain-containing protein [Virgibacillus soli]MDY0409089.1 ASCH domain-containing protein [Virgibacillus soli]
MINRYERIEKMGKDGTENKPIKLKEIKQLVTRQDDVAKVIKGEKTAVRRSNQFANVGDTFELQGVTLEVTHVYRQSLKEVTDADAIKEGYKDLAAYKRAISAIHGGMDWNPKLKVWVHEFKLI